MKTLIEWHNQTEILKIVDGKGQLFFDGEFFDLSKHDIVVVTPFRMHAICGNVEFETRKFLVENFDDCKEFLPILNARQIAPCIFADSEVDVEVLFAKDATELDIQSCLKNLLLALQSKNLVKTTMQPIFERQLHTVKTVLEFVAKNFHNEIRIADLARQTCFNEFYLMKVFKKVTGFCILDYIIFFRLLKAVELLQNTKNEISTVARQVGFFNISYFNRKFKQQFGCTPTEFLAEAKVTVD